MDALLRQIRHLEDQVTTQKNVLSTAKAAITWLESTTEDTLRDAADLKERVAKHIARPETKVVQLVLKVHVPDYIFQEVGTSIPSRPRSSSPYSQRSSPRSSSPYSQRSSSPYSPRSSSPYSQRSSSPYYRPRLSSPYNPRSSSPYYRPRLSSPYSPMKSGYNGSPSTSWASGTDVATLTDQGVMEVEDYEVQPMQVERSEIIVDRDNTWCYSSKPTEEVT